MTADEAIRELLQLSTDITSVAMVGVDGELVAWSPSEVDTGLPAAGKRLWDAAADCASAFAASPLDHVVVQDAAGAVAVIAAAGRHIIAVTGPRPALGLLVFDLRTCLCDVFAEVGS